MSSSVFLLLNLVLAFYNVGTIWAHEIDIFRTWRRVGTASFHEIQRVHWRKLPYWVLLPVGLALSGNLALLWYRPARVSLRPVGAAFLCQLTSMVLTAALWGPWQAKLSQDERGSESPYLSKILSTHWIRTALINLAALFLFCATLEMLI